MQCKAKWCKLARQKQSIKIHQKSDGTLPRTIHTKTLQPPYVIINERALYSNCLDSQFTNQFKVGLKTYGVRSDFWCETNSGQMGQTMYITNPFKNRNMSPIYQKCCQFIKMPKNNGTTFYTFLSNSNCGAIISYSTVSQVDVQYFSYTWCTLVMRSQFQLSK